jgi:hypothetical protein
MKPPMRVVAPEILDELPADDPDAARSRRDLRRINFLMGNERWICRVVSNFPEAGLRGIVEFGAGDGELAGKLAAMFPAAHLTACDLAPRPAALDGRVRWRRGDLLSGGASMNGGVLVANLFLHHFEGDALRMLGKLCDGFEVVVFNEPDRAILPHMLGLLMWPTINRVTRHDMHVSIRAGFAAGELPGLMGLEPGKWLFRETSTWRGARRVIGSRAR